MMLPRCCPGKDTAGMPAQKLTGWLSKLACQTKALCLQSSRPPDMTLTPANSLWLENAGFALSKEPKQSPHETQQDHLLPCGGNAVLHESVTPVARMPLIPSPAEALPNPAASGSSCGCSRAVGALQQCRWLPSGKRHACQYCEGCASVSTLGRAVGKAVASIWHAVGCHRLQGR